MSEPILHITTPAAWAAARAAGTYVDPSLAREGFIHCSSAGQIVATADRFFAGSGDLLALVIDPDRLTAPVRHEASDQGTETFPHVYGPVDLEAVVAVHVLCEGPDGYAPPEPS